MGAEPYQYFVPYEADLQSALDKLRAQVFASGEFNGADLGPATPEEALLMAGEDGTQSILDISNISDEPDFCCAAPFADEQLKEWFGSTKPDRHQLDDCFDILWDEINRGQARYLVVYEAGEPRQLAFLGYSFD